MTHGRQDPAPALPLAGSIGLSIRVPERLVSASEGKADVMRRPQPTCYTSVCSAYFTRPQLCEYQFARDTLASSLLEHLTLFQGENRTFLQTFPALVIQWH